LKAVTSKAEILMTLLKREDEQKAAKAAAKAIAPAAPVNSATKTAEELIAEVEALKQRREG
jgi:hypothetical protein